ncbi:MAG: hypothetical protein EA409_02680 [Saprospirales bacterium]|nr:MAG: hypothetical protein EA409_02680 [Saprospirales bacterium]
MASVFYIKSGLCKTLVSRLRTFDWREATSVVLSDKPRWKVALGGQLTPVFLDIVEMYKCFGMRTGNTDAEI